MVRFSYLRKTCSNMSIETSQARCQHLRCPLPVLYCTIVVWLKAFSHSFLSPDPLLQRITQLLESCRARFFKGLLTGLKTTQGSITVPHGLCSQGQTSQACRGQDLLCLCCIHWMLHSLCQDGRAQTSLHRSDGTGSCERQQKHANLVRLSSSWLYFWLSIRSLYCAV